MKKIVLLCAGGMSTSVLVNKMKKEAEALGMEYDIDAFAVDSLKKVAVGADCILLGPQISHKKASVGKEVSCPVDCIDMRTYGMMDGKAALEQAMKMMGE